MLVTATFTHEILPPYGVPISSLRTQLDPFDVEIEGATVRIVPVIDEMSYSEPVAGADANEIGERQVHYHTLHSIKAVVKRKVKSVEPKKFDRTRFELPALAAISATLRQVRAATDITGVDVHVGTVAHEYVDAAGRALPWWSTNSINLDGVGSLNGDDWREVAKQVVNGNETSLAFELVMDARRFFRQRDYTMALMNAAIACEIYLNDLVAAALRQRMSITEDTAREWTKNIHNDKLLILVQSLYDLPTNVFLSDKKIDPIALIRRTFPRRNKVAHGDKGIRVTAEWAGEAIDAANRLANARPKRIDGDGGVAESVQPS